MAAAHGQLRRPQPGRRPEERSRSPFAARAASTAGTSAQLLARLDRALLARNTDESLALVDAYVHGAFDQAALIQVLATDAAKFGNDPHNQEICLCFLEDYVNSTAVDRERLLFGLRQEPDRLPQVRRPAGGVQPLRRRLRPRSRPIATWRQACRGARPRRLGVRTTSDGRASSSYRARG